MMTARKRVGPLPTHRLAVRHSVDYSSSDHFSLEDSLRDSSSSSSSKTSSDSSVDALSDSDSSCLSSDHSLPTPSLGMRPSYHLCSLVPSIHRSSAIISDRPSHDSSSAGPSRKMSRSPTASVPLYSPTLGALSYARADILPSPKRIRSPETATDLEGCSKDSFDPYVPRETGFRVDFVDESSEPSRFKGTDLEIDVDVVRRNGIDIDPEIQAEIDECFAYADGLRDRGVDARVIVEAIDQEEIEMGMRGPVKVRVDRVTHLVVANDIPKPAQEGAIEVTYETLRDLIQRIVATGQQSADMLEMIRELERDNKRLRDMMDVTSQRVARTIPNTRSGASRTRKGLNEQINRQMAGALGARTTAMNLELLMRDGGGQEEVNGNGGNGNGNGNGGGIGYNFKGFVPARECTYQDFLKCQPLSFNGTEGVVGLTRWFEKMETVFDIRNCPERYQVKYASCTLLNSALTWWNSHKRTIGTKAAYAISWAKLMKLMTEVYCPRNKVQKMEIEMVPNEEDKVKRCVGGLLDNIQGNNVGGQTIARAYTAGNNKKKGYVGSLPYCNKCKLHHAGSCTIRCGNGHFRKECPKLRNQNRGNKTGNKNGNQTGSNEATTKAYAYRGGGSNPDSNVVKSTFLLNNHYASMLFDSGADRSFVSSTFSALRDVAPSTLDTSYAVELADGRISKTNVVLRGYTLGLVGHTFDIDLMPIELGSFDVIIGMDWLAKYHAVIVCDEKVVRIPYGDEVLIIQGDDYHSFVMAISVISVSLNSSEESVGTSTGRVILFGTISTTTPDTKLFLIYPRESVIDNIYLPLPATSLFLSSTDDSSDSDIPDTPPSPTYGTPFTKTTLSTKSLPVASGALRRCEEEVGRYLTSCLAVRHSIDYSSSDHFSLDDSLRDSSSSSSSETSLDSSADALSDISSSVHLLIIHYPHHHWTGLGVNFVDESSEPSRFRGTYLEIDVDVMRSNEINECFAYADALRDIRVDARVVVEAIDQEETKTGMRGLVEVRVDRVTHLVVADDIPEPTQEGVVEVTYETLGDLVQRFHDHTVEILVRRVQLERDNRRLRDMMDVASQRVVRSQHRELRVQKEMRQIWRFRFYDRIRIARLEAYARRHLGFHS
ncbi:putative reverse transcriptase domain-containing protein [Tanacetum coccineum]